MDGRITRSKPQSGSVAGSVSRKTRESQASQPPWGLGLCAASCFKPNSWWVAGEARVVRAAVGGRARPLGPPAPVPSALLILNPSTHHDALSRPFGESVVLPTPAFQSPVHRSVSVSAPRLQIPHYAGLIGPSSSLPPDWKFDWT